MQQDGEYVHKREGTWVKGYKMGREMMSPILETRKKEQPALQQGHLPDMISKYETNLVLVV